MALGSEPYRRIYPADVVALRDVSPLAERVYMHLAFGERSRACCLVACDPEWLRLAVRTRSVPEVMAALGELADAGWLVLDQRAKQAWLPRQASRTAHDKDSQLIGWRKEIDLFKDSEAKAQAIAFIESKVNPRPTPVLRPSPSSNSNSNSNSSSTFLHSIPYGMPNADDSAQASRFPDPDPSWFADPEPKPQRKPEPPLLIRNPHLRAAKGLPPLDEPEPQAAPEPEPEPADDAIPDWAAAAAAKAAVPEALPARAPVQLTLKEPKSKKPLTEAQKDAIFAKQQMAKWVDKWNRTMAAKHCAPAVPKALAPMAKSLIANLACIYSQDPLACPTDLIDWALEHSEYHAGRKGKRWTLAQWLSADHLGQMWTDYRDRCDGLGMRSVWLFRVDRTIADWRAAIEERQAIIARGNAINAAIESGQPYLHLGGAHA